MQLWTFPRLHFLWNNIHRSFLGGTSWTQKNWKNTIATGTDAEVRDT